MSLLTGTDTEMLWQGVVKNAESRCEVKLQEELEAYLISLLIRYTNKPEIVKQVFALSFLDALQKQKNEPNSASLQNVGDQCLLFAGLFPHSTERRLIKIKYYVDVGRRAYSSVSQTTNDLYGSLAMQFVVLMDVLQCIPENSLLPYEAYHQWQEVGSHRAYRILKEYGNILPFRGIK